MKQKHNELIVKLILVLFIVISGYCVNVFAQYYYFSSGGNTYQQWCEEVLEIRVNSQWQKVRAWRFHLLLDPLTTIYMHTDSVADLRNFFQASSNTFMSWTSEWSPSWKSGSNYTILQADRNNWTQDYNWTNWLYANVRFVPEYSGSLYGITFGMEYSSGDSTTETTLSKEWWKEIIDPVQQNIYRTWTSTALTTAR